MNATNTWLWLPLLKVTERYKRSLLPLLLQTNWHREMVRPCVHTRCVQSYCDRIRIYQDWNNPTIKRPKSFLSILHLKKILIRINRPWYDTKFYTDVRLPVLKLWKVWDISSLTLLSWLLWPGVVLLVSVLYMIPMRSIWKLLVLNSNTWKLITDWK